MSGQTSVLPGLVPAGGAGAGILPGLGINNGTGGFGAIGGPGQAGAYGTGLGWNVGTGQLALSGLSALGNLWNAFQAQGLAREQFDFTKRFAERNLANQTQSYNTALTDRITSRAHTQGMSAADRDAYLDANWLR